MPLVRIEKNKGGFGRISVENASNQGCNNDSDNQICAIRFVIRVRITGTNVTDL